MEPEVGLDGVGERLGGILEELAQELFRDEVAQAVEELNFGGGVEEDDAQRTVPRALCRAEAEVELGAVDLEAEREQLEELDALVAVELGALLERERAEFFVRDVDLAVAEAHGGRARRAGSAEVERGRGRGGRSSRIVTRRARLERGDAQVEVRAIARHVAPDHGDAGAEVGDEALGARCRCNAGRVSSCSRRAR